MKTILEPDHLMVFNLARGLGMSDAPSAEQITATLKDLREVQGTALIIGGIAVGHHGWRRFTGDVDILYAEADSKILTRLKKYFRLQVKANSGWHKLVHKKTGVRLELIPEGGLTTYGFIPGPKTVGGDGGFISLFGLIWLKLASGRARDIADLTDLCRIRMADMEQAIAKLPDELHRIRLTEIIAQAKLEMKNDPHYEPPSDRAKELPAAYGKPRARKPRRPAKSVVKR